MAAPSTAELIALGALAAAFLGAGLVTRAIGTSVLENTAQVESLAPVGAEQLRNTPPGAAVLVEGQLSAANPTAFRAFVCYVQHRFQPRKDATSRSAQWLEEKRVTPPLLLDTPGGEVSVSNSDYLLDAPEALKVYELAEQGPAHFQDQESVQYDELRGIATRRYTGFERGQRTLVLGTLEEQAGPRVSARWLFGGSKQEYLADKASTLKVLGWLWPLFLVISAGMGLLFLWRGWLRFTAA